MKAIVWRSVKWLLGALVLAVLIWLNWDKLGEMYEKGGNFEWNWLLVAGAVFLGGVLLTFLRWYLLVRAVELPFRLIDAIRLGFVSLFFSAFLPGSIGGDLVKAGFLAREQHRRTVAISTIILDRIVGLVGLIFLASLAGLFFWNDLNAVVDVHGNRPLRWIVMFVWGVSATVIIGLLVLTLLPIRSALVLERLHRFGRVGRILGEMIRALHVYRHKLGMLSLAMLLAMIGHVGFVLSFYFAACAVPPPIPSLEEHWLLIPVGMVAESIPLTPGNLGVGEACYEYLYHLVDTGGQYDGKGALARLGQRVVNWIIALIGFGFYLPLRRTVRQLIAEEEKQATADEQAKKLESGGTGWPPAESQPIKQRSEGGQPVQQSRVPGAS